MNKKKKVAIYYSVSYGRNDGPPLFYFNVLKNQMKFNVKHLVPKGDITRFGKFDYHFWVDWGEDALNFPNWKIPNDGGKKIYVVSDYHLDKTKYRIKKAKEFDYTFLNQKWYIDEFDKAGLTNLFYLPHAVEPKAYPNFNIIKKYDICFIGHIQKEHCGNFVNVSRLDALDRIFKEIPNFYFGFRTPLDPTINIFEDASKKYSMSKIVFNISAGNDVNMRVFEAMSSGSMLLTNWLPELVELFEDGKELVTYKTMDEAVNKANYYIKHDQEREKIAKAGFDKVRAKHTYRDRLDSIFAIIDRKEGE